VSPDHAAAILSQFIGAVLMMAGPILLACLLGGVIVGVVQTATQINEASISYVAKAGLLILVLLLAGGAMADKLIQYTRASFNAITEVAR
jgi:flagellar biosynthetic protein FliQ